MKSGQHTHASFSDNTVMKKARRDHKNSLLSSVLLFQLNVIKGMTLGQRFLSSSNASSSNNVATGKFNVLALNRSILLFTQGLLFTDQTDTIL